MTVPPGQPAPEHRAFPIAALDRRFYAFAVDRALAWLLIAVAAGITWVSTGDWLITLVVGLSAMVLIWLVLAVVAGVKGTSPGKAMTQLRLVNDGSGSPVGVGRSLLRAFVLGAATLPTLGLGLVTLAWTAVEDPRRQRRGWHDLLARSVVVDVRPVEQRTEVEHSEPRHVVNLTAMRLIPAPPVEVPVVTPKRVNPELSMPREVLRQEPVIPAGPRGVPSQSVTDVPNLPLVQTPSRVDGPPPGAAPPPPRQAPTPAPYAEERTVVRGGRPPRVGPVWRVTFDDGASFVVEGLTLVGRRPEPRSGEQVHRLVPLGSRDMSVSKTHAQFGPASDGTLVVMDRGSTNGSTLMRRGVSKALPAGQPMTLVEGDQVSFGDRSMVVVREG